MEVKKSKLSLPFLLESYTQQYISYVVSVSVSDLDSFSLFQISKVDIGQIKYVNPIEEEEIVLTL